VSHEERTAYVHAAYDRARGKGFADDGRRKVLVIGDSHSQDFYNMARENGAFGDVDLAVAYVFAACQLYLGDDTEFIAPADRAGCAGGRGARATLELARHADTAIFVASWRPWAAERLPETIRAYGFRPDQQVIVISRKSFEGLNLRRLLNADPATFPGMHAEQPEAQRQSVEATRRSVSAEMLVDPQAIVCGPGWDCPIFTPAGELISHDGSHLTQAGARYVGALLFQDPLLAPFAPRHARR
jgi:hypothetical protein